jgi:mediator of RNA polymerase II transcription subunit 18
MHEYVLYAQVPHERIDTALQVLAGYTRSQPVDLCEQTLIYAQLKVPEVAVSKKVRTNDSERNQVYNMKLADNAI